MEIHTEEDMEAAAKAIYEDLGCAVLLKGGHNINDANDLYIQKKKFPGLKEKESITLKYTMEQMHSFSGAIAANLAKGFDLKISAQCQRLFQEHWQICWILGLEADNESCI